MSYEIREIYEHELPAALDFARGTFDVQIAAGLEERDRADFYGLTDCEGVISRRQNGDLHIFGAFDRGVLVAVSSFTSSGNILFFFVESRYQNSGVEIELMRLIGYICEKNFRANELFVEVPWVQIAMYQFMGFGHADVSSSQATSRFVRMTLVISSQYSAIPEPWHVKKDRKKEYILLAVIIVVIAVGSIAVVLIGMRIFGDIDLRPGMNDNVNQRPEIPSVNPFNKPGREEEAFDDESGDGLYFVDEFIANNLPFSFRDEVWELYEESDDGNTVFVVAYPVIEGMEDEIIQDKINSEIESCAMSSRDTLYPELPENVKEYLDGDYYWRESIVEYKIAYLDKNVLSVVFYDHYFLGSVYAEYADLRTRTFDLRTGEVCELNELLVLDESISDELIYDFRAKMLDENPDSDVFTDKKVVSDDVLRRILQGEVVDNRYFSTFFFTERGIEIGVTYHYRSSDGNIITRGYRTTHFDYEEIWTYIQPHALWDMLPFSE